MRQAPTAEVNAWLDSLAMLRKNTPVMRNGKPQPVRKVSKSFLEKQKAKGNK